MVLANSSNNIDIEKLNIINNFEALPDWQMKYGYLIDLGKQLISNNEHIKIDDNRFYGCQSSVWLSASSENNTITYQGTSDSVIVAGLISLLLHVYSKRTPQQIVDTEPDFLEKTGLIHNLSSQRTTGLLLMVDQIKVTAKQHLRT